MKGSGPASSEWLSCSTRFCGPISTVVILVFYREGWREGEGSRGMEGGREGEGGGVGKVKYKWFPSFSPGPGRGRSSLVRYQQSF